MAWANPNRSDPTISFHGVQFPRMSAARAMKPSPCVWPSWNSWLTSIARKAPAKPASVPEIPTPTSRSGAALRPGHRVDERENQPGRSTDEQAGHGTPVGGSPRAGDRPDDHHAFEADVDDARPLAEQPAEARQVDDREVIPGDGNGGPKVQEWHQA